MQFQWVKFQINSWNSTTQWWQSQCIVSSGQRPFKKPEECCGTWLEFWFWAYLVAGALRFRRRATNIWIVFYFCVWLPLKPSLCSCWRSINRPRTQLWLALLMAGFTTWPAIRCPILRFISQIYEPDITIYRQKRYITFCQPVNSIASLHTIESW